MLLDFNLDLERVIEDNNMLHIGEVYSGHCQ